MRGQSLSLKQTRKTWKQPKGQLTDEWIKKNIYIYKCVYTTEYYSAIKNEIMPFATTWTDLDIITLSEINQRKIPYGITYK